MRKWLSDKRMYNTAGCRRWVGEQLAVASGGPQASVHAWGFPKRKLPLQDKAAQEREAEAVAAGGNGASSNGASANNGAEGPPRHLHNPLSPYRVRVDIPDLLSEQLRKF